MNDKSFLTQAFKNSLKPVGSLYAKPPPKKKLTMRDYAERAKKQRLMTYKAGKRKSKPKLPKKVKIKSLEAKLKKILYPLIKARDGPICISCGKTGLVGWNLQAGHYAKAELCNLIYRYDVRNINSQCGYCNKWLRGNTINYRNAMIKKYGRLVVEEIDAHFKDQTPMDFNEREYLLGLIKKYAKS